MPNPAALRTVRGALVAGYGGRLADHVADWVPHVRRLCPDTAWEDVLHVVNAPPAPGAGPNAD